MKESKKTSNWYKKYYLEKGEYRNDLLRNPEVLFQTLAYDISMIRAFRSTELIPSTTRVLDVGCGGGGSIINLLRLGFYPSNIHGIDIQKERIHESSFRLPNSHFQCADATCMNYKSNSFDLVFESTMFVQITDESVAKSIACEMLRVVKTGGYIIIADWRYNKPGKSDYSAVTKKKLSHFFGVDTKCNIIGVHSGAIVPPVGRFLSKRMPFAYFMIRTLFPFLVGQVTTVLQKIEN